MFNLRAIDPLDALYCVSQTKDLFDVSEEDANETDAYKRKQKLQKIMFEEAPQQDVRFYCIKIGNKEIFRDRDMHVVDIK